MTRGAVLAAFAVGTALAFGSAAAPANADVVSASIAGTTATLNLDASDNNEVVSVQNGLLVHSGLGFGLKSTADWDSAAAGEQTVPADGTQSIVVNGGSGNDAISVVGSGNDTVFGLGNDIASAELNGGAGDDTFVWSDGASSGTIDGGAGEDTVQVNGSPTLGDTFTLTPERGLVRFDSTNLTPFSLLGSAEHFQVNGLGGDDFISAADGVGALTQLALDGGSGRDFIRGSEGPDLLVGGSGNDRIDASGGRDVVVAGNGDDQVDIRDSTPDLASGGDGTDQVIADADGVDSLDGFESVDRPAPVAVGPPPVTVPPPPVTVPPPPIANDPPPVPVPNATVLPATISTHTAKVTASGAAVRISCPAPSAGHCRGLLTLRTTKRGLLGSSRYDLAPGASKTVNVKLARAARRSVARSRGLKVVAIATTSKAGQSTRTVTLVAERAKRVGSH